MQRSKTFQSPSRSMLSRTSSMLSFTRPFSSSMFLAFTSRTDSTVLVVVAIVASKERWRTPSARPPVARRIAVHATFAGRVDHAANVGERVFDAPRAECP